MTNLSHYTTADLLAILRRNAPPEGVRCTWAPSPCCGAVSRGGGVCGACAEAELRRREAAKREGVSA